MFDVAKSLLRYWEGEFKEIQPRKDSGGIRRYTAKDIEHIDHIYDLLKNRGFTIEGARKQLLVRSRKKSSKKAASKSASASNDIKARLEGTLKRLKALRNQI